MIRGFVAGTSGQSHFYTRENKTPRESASAASRNGRVDCSNGGASCSKNTPDLGQGIRARHGLTVCSVPCVEHAYFSPMPRHARRKRLNSRSFLQL